MLETRDLAAYRESAVVLRGVNLRVVEGRALGLVGQSGSGKSTLLDVLAGLLPASAGDVSLAGELVTSWPAFRRSRSGLRLVRPSDSLCPSLTVADHFRLVATDQRETFPTLSLLRGTSAVQVRNLSGGMQRALALTLSLSSASRLVLIDDFVEGLQPAVVSELLDVLLHIRATTTKTFMIVDRSLDVLSRICDDVVAMRDGRIVCRRPFPLQPNDAQTLGDLAESGIDCA